MASIPLPHIHVFFIYLMNVLLTHFHSNRLRVLLWSSSFLFRIYEQFFFRQVSIVLIFLQWYHRHKKKNIINRFFFSLFFRFMAISTQITIHLYVSLAKNFGKNLLKMMLNWTFEHLITTNNNFVQNNVYGSCIICGLHNFFLIFCLQFWYINISAHFWHCSFKKFPDFFYLESAGGKQARFFYLFSILDYRMHN